MPRSIDYAPLTTVPTPEAVRAAGRSAAGAGSWLGDARIQLVIGVPVVVVVGTIWLGITVPGLLEATSGSGRTIGIATVVLPLLILVGVAVSVIRGAAARRARWARIEAFARANGLRFAPTGGDPGYPGAVFQTGNDRRRTEHVTATAPRFIEIGDYRYTTGSGKNRSTHDWGYLAFRLDRRLPQMVLDSRANNGLFGGTTLPISFDRSQVLHLEGDFDRHFTLYAPQDYERDALYVFTPDLMALLIDEAAPFDVEIVDDWMFVYSAARLDMAQPAVYQRMFRIVDTVGAKTLSQTERYRDDRVSTFAGNVVAPQGSRLKRSTSVWAVVFMVAFAGFWLWSAFGGH